MLDLVLVETGIFRLVQSVLILMILPFQLSRWLAVGIDMFHIKSMFSFWDYFIIRLPTLINLPNWSIDLESIVCPLCEERWSILPMYFSWLRIGKVSLGYDVSLDGYCFLNGVDVLEILMWIDERYLSSTKKRQLKWSLWQQFGWYGQQGILSYAILIVLEKFHWLKRMFFLVGLLVTTNLISLHNSYFVVYLAICYFFLHVARLFLIFDLKIIYILTNAPWKIPHIRIYPIKKKKKKKETIEKSITQYPYPICIGFDNKKIAKQLLVIIQIYIFIDLQILK